MQLEVFDAFSLFMAGFSVGLIGAHYLNKYERRLEYNRGVMHAIWQVQLIWMREHIGRVFCASGDKKTGGEAGDQKPV